MLFCRTKTSCMPIVICFKFKKEMHSLFPEGVNQHESSTPHTPMLHECVRTVEKGNEPFDIEVDFWVKLHHLPKCQASSCQIMREKLALRARPQCFSQKIQLRTESQLYRFGLFLNLQARSARESCAVSRFRSAVVMP